jgi:hypothetical protein
LKKYVSTYVIKKLYEYREKIPPERENILVYIEVASSRRKERFLLYSTLGTIFPNGKVTAYPNNGIQ